MYGEKYIDKVIEWRRNIHSHPELSQHEARTSELAASVLEGLGLEVKRNIGGYGVVGLLRGKHEEKTIALRADMDALPLNEETGLSYASQNPGVMHACGHDTHTAMLLGAACALCEMRDKLNGNVKFIFQPAEELNPTGGAPGMIHDGVLDNPNVDAMLALHVWPAYETGKIITRSGALMAASDRIFITVHGKTAHGSRPDQGVDAIVAAANIITGLQSIISRSVSPLDSAVLTIGTIHGGYRYNVIPDCVKLEGTVRTLNPDVQNQMPGLITRTAKNIAEAFGASCDVEYVKGYPPMMNDAKLAGLVCESVRRHMGNDALIIAEQPDLTAEDFAFFARERPAVMAWLGCRPANQSIKDTAMLHNTKFCPDESCFIYGINFFTSCVIDYLNS